VVSRAGRAPPYTVPTATRDTDSDCDTYHSMSIPESVNKNTIYCTVDVVYTTQCTRGRRAERTGLEREGERRVRAAWRACRAVARARWPVCGAAYKI
jgi:hypothetical protein